MGQLLEFAGRHALLVGGFVAALLTALFYELWLRSRTLTNVSSADAVRLINKGAIVIDVRKPEEFGAGHIVNARNIAYDRIQQGDDALTKFKNKVLLTVCDSGAASNRAASVLRKAGIANVFSLRNGLTGWRADNLPLVK